MSEVTIDKLTNLVEALPVNDQQQLLQQLREKLEPAVVPANGVKLIPPIRLPDPIPSQRWINEHALEYGGQWVALDGDRLISHGFLAADVYAAARVDGVYLPLVTYIPAADAPPFIGL